MDKICNYKCANALLLRVLIYSIGILLLASCSATKPPKLSKGHLDVKSTDIATNPQPNIPNPVFRAPVVPLPKPPVKQETYTVVVSDVPVKQLLFSLARDAKLNVDIHPSITGKVTINAVKQTLPQILDRLANQVNIRYQIQRGTLVIKPDSPYWQNYRVNYVNMNRKSVSEISVATQIATTGGSVNQSSSGSSGSSGGSSSDEGNSSKTKVTNSSNNDFWKTIVNNLNAIIGIKTDDKSGTSNVIANPTCGIISVRATQKQHMEIEKFLSHVMTNAQRQVLIEMTIVEVELANRYQGGIDWQRLSNNSGTGSNGLSFISNLVGSNLNTAPVFSVGYNKTTASGSNLSGTLKTLETFGNVKVLSSPKLLALNNQTALLKVVDEKVYFTVKMEIQEATTTTAERRIFTSSIHTVPVGLVMSVVPQINENGYVTLNIRPTITRITGFATDPGPALSGQNYTNLIPEIQIREMESLIQVADQQMIVMGGLMQNKIDKSDKSPAGLKKLQTVQKLLSYKDHNLTKTELVIFLRPTVIKGSRMNQKVKSLRHYLPGSTGSIFHKSPPSAKRGKGS